ncbi:C6 transcription factor [Penicillium malachiteum]|uniref:C6 transcription factor n=1 Tax=Penicillium malachiteum TaxID=1324776 RepID=A0AAD6HG59_9EURO|nr:C6 transcription factor [Penicillium malachiteum]
MNPTQSELPGQSSKDVIKRRYDVERSCIRCHERKVRCDRANPCSNCLRAKIPCRYPGPERTKRRSQKKSTARTDQFGPRLAMLERAIATLTQQASGERDRLAHTSSSTVSTEQTPENTYTHTHASRGSPNEGLLVKEGTSTRYMDESLFMQLLEKSELRSAIDSPTSSDGSLRVSSSFDGLISKPQGSTDISSLYPSRGQARQLWQIYLNNVDALIKILHVPSIQPVIFAAINKPKGAPADLNALIFAIFFAAVTTLSSEETQMVLGSSRYSAVEAYRRGLEVSLHRASFLDSPTLHSIQAMAIYLVSINLSVWLMLWLPY